MPAAACPTWPPTASGNSGYPLTVGGFRFIGGGTSASAPLWAGLIARLNAALGEDVGFVNPVLYALGSSVFRDIVAHPGAADNGFGDPGYPVSPAGMPAPDGAAPAARRCSRVCATSTDRRRRQPAGRPPVRDRLPRAGVPDVTVSNVGRPDLMVLDVARVAGSTAFSVLPLPSTPLALVPGAEITFTVEYQPVGRWPHRGRHHPDHQQRPG